MENDLPFLIDIYNPLNESSIELLTRAYDEAVANRNEYIVPEHVLIVLTSNKDFIRSIKYLEGDLENLKQKTNKYIEELDRVPENADYSPVASIQLKQMIDYADNNVISCGKSTIEIHHLMRGLLELEENWGQYLLYTTINGNQGLFLAEFLGDDYDGFGMDEFDEDDEEDLFSLDNKTSGSNKEKSDWKNMVVCINDIYKNHNPLIGKEDELVKTIRVLCRKEKNNPLHIGEPGVGKTALVYGLAAMIEEGNVPEKTQGSQNLPYGFREPCCRNTIPR